MKKFVFKQIVAGAMAAAISLSTGVTAFAADQQQITPGNTGSTTVKATVESEAVVWLPTNITLSGAPDENKKYTGEGAVIVEGDIAGNEFVSVTPESSISLKQSGKDDIIAQVTQEKTTFTYDDLQNSNSAVTSISADTLSAGEWNSVLHYNVSLDENPLPAGYTTLYEYDLSATEADDVKAYYMVPNKNTSPIEVETQASKAKSRAAAASDQAEADNIIEYNGIRYVLSDEDELVISGEGEMKENIQADLIDHFGCATDIAGKYGYKYYVATDGHAYENGKMISADDIGEDEIVMVFGINDFIPSFALHDPGHPYPFDKIENYDEIIEYTDSIKPNYTFTNLKKVTITNGVTNISEYAFYNCETLEEISISNTVTTIEDNAFAGCSSLKEITIPDSVTSLGKYSFDDCTSLNKISFGKGLSEIPSYTFRDCPNLKSVTLPENIKTVQMRAFTDTGLSELHINAPISLLGASFDGRIIDLHVNDLNDLYNSYIYRSDGGNDNHFDNLYLNDQLVTEVTIPDGTQEVKNLFFASIQKVSIPDTVTTIGSYAFSESSISNLNLPDSVTEIGSYAYQKCRNLIVIDNLPSQLTTIGGGAFEWCTNLTKVIIPDSVTSIYAGAFSYCKSLTDVEISDDSLKSIANSSLVRSVFSQCPCEAELLERYNALNS